MIGLRQPLSPFARGLPREQAHDLDQRRRLAVNGLLSIFTDASHAKRPKLRAVEHFRGELADRRFHKTSFVFHKTYRGFCARDDVAARQPRSNIGYDERELLGAIRNFVPCTSNGLLRDLPQQGTSTLKPRMHHLDRGCRRQLSLCNEFLDRFDDLVNKRWPARWFLRRALRCVAGPRFLPLLVRQPTAKLFFVETKRITGQFFEVRPRKSKRGFGKSSAISERQHCAIEREECGLYEPQIVKPHWRITRGQEGEQC